MNTALGFLKEYSGRINYILSLPSQFLSKDSSEFKQLGASEPSINLGQPPNYKKFSVAVSFVENKCINPLFLPSILKNLNGQQHY